MILETWTRETKQQRQPTIDFSASEENSNKKFFEKVRRFVIEERNAKQRASKTSRRVPHFGLQMRLFDWVQFHLAEQNKQNQQTNKQTNQPTTQSNSKQASKQASERATIPTFDFVCRVDVAAFFSLLTPTIETKKRKWSKTTKC